MVQNIWIRGKELATFLGLMASGLGIIIIGNQIFNKWIYWFGVISTSLFTTLSLITLLLAIRDAYYHPKNFWVGLPLKG